MISEYHYKYLNRGFRKLQIGEKLSPELNIAVKLNEKTTS